MHFGISNFLADIKLRLSQPPFILHFCEDQKCFTLQINFFPTDDDIFFKKEKKKGMIVNGFVLLVNFKKLMIL